LLISVRPLLSARCCDDVGTGVLKLKADSWKLHSSLSPQRFDGIQGGGFAGWIKAGYYSAKYQASEGQRG
jgi:hypothetical protein